MQTRQLQDDVHPVNSAFIESYPNSVSAAPRCFSPPVFWGLGRRRELGSAERPGDRIGNPGPETKPRGEQGASAVS
jgi:hypothetical protein